jgi:hypothetical protein
MVDNHRQHHDNTYNNYGRTGHWAKDYQQAKRGGQAHIM